MSSHLALLNRVVPDLQGGDLVFPTSARVALQIRSSLANPNLSVGQLVALLEVEPLVTARLLRLANCATFNPSGNYSTSLAVAVQRLGLEVVRSVALMVAMDELRRTDVVQQFADLSNATWRHSVKVSSLCRSLSREMGHADADEAWLAGLMSEVGVYFLLYHAGGEVAYRDDRALLLDLLNQHAHMVGTELCRSLGLSEVLCQAVAGGASELSLGRALHVARLLAQDSDTPSYLLEQEREPDERALLEAHFRSVMDASRDNLVALEHAMCG